MRRRPTAMDSRMTRAFNSDLDLPPVEASFRYVVLSQPRSGSAMLISSLRSTGVAGVPAEYLNGRHLQSLPQPLTLDTVLEYYASVQTRRTTPNGWFGVKLHFSQFRKWFMDGNEVTEAGMQFLRSHSHFVLTSRRDRIAQAISSLAASRSEVWNSRNDADAGGQTYSFVRSDIPEILHHLRQTMVEELSWREISNRLGLECLEIVYEDLAASPQAEIERVYAFLGIDAEYAPPATVKLSRDGNREAKRQFLEAIGAFIG